MRSMTWVVRGAALYNASGVLVFLTPGALGLLGVDLPYSPFWIWLPALMALFAVIVLTLSSLDLQTYGSFPYWNGIIRLTFVVAAFSLDFGATVGPFITVLAIGDLFLALACIFGLPYALRRTHLQLLTNRAAPERRPAGAG